MPSSTAPVRAEGPTDTAAEHAISDSIDRVLGDHASYQAAIARLQQAVATKDAAAVATLVAYPFTATIDGRKMLLKDADALVAQYDHIVTPAIAEVIAEQKYADLMVSAKGVMFGSGEVWLNGVCKDKACSAPEVKVIAIQPGSR